MTRFESCWDWAIVGFIGWTVGIELGKLALLLSLKEEGKGLLILNLRSSLPSL
ncbi:hypothetical protein [Microcoleus sp. D3_18_C4]|uniref:hypothetical protein n=1 Tax=Microcoleus sp. D3_18_C4 TaxID=3055335 RepID=UPI002FD55276